MICPLLRERCAGEGCAWWQEYSSERSTWKQCAFLQLVSDLRYLHLAIGEMVYGYGLSVKVTSRSETW